MPSVLSLPWDMTALVPPGVQVLTVTLNVRNGRPGEADHAIASLQRATDVLVDEGAGAIVVMGVPVAARRGYAADQAELAALTAQRGAVPISSSLTAVGASLRATAAKAPLFVTQYDEPINHQIINFCRDMGVDPIGAVGLGATNSAAVNALTVGDFDRLARQAKADYPDADTIVLCARSNMLALSRTLAADLDIPVIEQIQASVRWGISQMSMAASVSADPL
jgi:maleate cis-trans isomerase